MPVITDKNVSDITAVILVTYRIETVKVQMQLFRYMLSYLKAVFVGLYGESMKFRTSDAELQLTDF
jgi:hypothetical protein